MVPYLFPLLPPFALIRNDAIDSRSEKSARATLFAAIQRQMGQDTILIVDALNYIKGFRYQLYCAAREFKLRVCTVGFRVTRLGAPMIDARQVGLRRRYSRTMQAMEQ